LLSHCSPGRGSRLLIRWRTVRSLNFLLPRSHPPPGRARAREQSEDQGSRPDQKRPSMYSDVIYSFGIGLCGAILFLIVDKYEKNLLRVI
jgi:hypothetical protein